MHSAPAGPAGHKYVVASTQAALAAIKCRCRCALHTMLGNATKRWQASKSAGSLARRTCSARLQHEGLTLRADGRGAVRCGIDLLPCTCIKEEACKQAPNSFMNTIHVFEIRSEDVTRTTLAEHKHAPLMHKHELLLAVVKFAACRMDRAVFSGQATHAV